MRRRVYPLVVALLAALTIPVLQWLMDTTGARWLIFPFMTLFIAATLIAHRRGRELDGLERNLRRTETKSNTES